MSVAALAIIAALILVFHIAVSAVLAHPLAHASRPVLDNDALCLGDAKPPMPSLPFD